MNLITDTERQQLIANGLASQEQERDHAPVVKLFTPDANATWLLTELIDGTGSRVRTGAISDSAARARLREPRRTRDLSRLAGPAC